MKIAELERLDHLPNADEIILPIYSVENGMPLRPVYKISICKISEAIKNEVTKGSEVIMIETENGIIFKINAKL